MSLPVFCHVYFCTEKFVPGVLAEDAAVCCLEGTDCYFHSQHIIIIIIVRELKETDKSLGTVFFDLRISY